jgi:predicted ATPase
MPGKNPNDTERKLLKRWNSNFGPVLRSVEIRGSGIRGLRDLTIDFRYPLTVIVGKNGVGKSTILACVCCAYQNHTGYRTLFSRKPYYTFDDYFFAGWGETPVRNVTVSWTCRDQKGLVQIVSVKKSKSRWDGYRRRHQRVVEYVGTLRAVHPTELQLLKNRFGLKASDVNSAPLDDDHRAVVGQIIGRDYSSVDVCESGRHHLHRLRFGESHYSGFNSGSGEDISCLLTRIVNRIPEHGLLVIEEVETGLHPSAQRKLAAFLLEACLKRKIQIICTSHSADFLSAVPSEARILLVRSGTTTEPRYEVTVGEATRDLLGVSDAELVICVEDRVADCLIQELLPAGVRRRGRIVPCGSWQDVLRQLSAFVKDPSLGEAVGVLDGDRRNSDGEHDNIFKEYLGGHLTPVQQAWLKERLAYLPGNEAPEKWLWKLGRDSAAYRESLAVQLKAEVDEIRSFFVGPPPADFHDVPFLLSQEVGSTRDRILVALCNAAIQTEPFSIQDILDFVQAWLAKN